MAASATLAVPEVAARLRLAVMRLARRLRQQAEGEVTPSQLSALSSVARLGPLTLGELSAIERVRPPTMTKVVGGLEQLGLIARDVDIEDRRVVRVRVTAEGRRFVNRSRTRRDAYLAARLRQLDADEVTTLDQAAAILERLMDEERP